MINTIKNTLLKAMIFIIIIITSLSSISVKANAASDIIVNLDGKNLKFEQSPVVIEGRTLVPLRVIFEAMNINVRWDQKTKIISANNEKVIITLQIDSPDASLGNEEAGYIKAKLDIPPKIINGRTMVPLRFIGEASGSTVAWNQGLKTVIITTHPKREFIYSKGSNVYEGKNITYTYLGYIEDELAEGYGRNIWEHGDIYVGEFANDMRNGFGTYTFAYGDKYVGSWKDDMYHGFGTSTWADGDKYVGEYVNDLRNGFGTYTWKDGEKYVGNWKDDMRNGFGTNTWPDGSKKYGYWEDDILY